jgi:DUF971 family protein
MSFWDTLKPAVKPHSVKDIGFGPGKASVVLRWTDDVESVLSAQELRRACPCAQCVDEWSGKRTLDIESVPSSMRILELGLVGNYAISITFDDQHRTGIFTWPLLRELQPPAKLV